MTTAIPDSKKSHWVNRSPEAIRPYLQLSRLDRPVGYWLLALPGWIGIAFAGFTRGLAWPDLWLAALILIGAIAMRGAGCTYNDIVDQDLDAQVERTALRPLPAGTVTSRQAWIWLFAQCGIGLIVLLLLPTRFAQIIALCSIPLVAAYPFMKRITWFPQVWLGLTFNWAVLVAYAAKTGEVTPALGLLYAGLIFWTVGYDTIYACQDIEDDGLVGIKSTARKFGSRVKLGVGVCYLLCVALITIAVTNDGYLVIESCGRFIGGQLKWNEIPRFNLLYFLFFPILPTSLFACFLIYQIWRFKFLPTEQNNKTYLHLFKINGVAGVVLAVQIVLFSAATTGKVSDDRACWALGRSDNPAQVYIELCVDRQTSRLCRIPE